MTDGIIIPNIYLSIQKIIYLPGTVLDPRDTGGKNVQKILSTEVYLHPKKKQRKRNRINKSKMINEDC